MFDQKYFQQFSSKKDIFIAGCDEVGRGPLAGPVVSACASLHQKKFDKKEFLEILDSLNLLGVSDSKKIPHIKRLSIVETLIPELRVHQTLSIPVSNNAELKIFIQEISVDIIDEVNILNASLLAMRKSFEQSCSELCNGIVLIDGNKKFISKRDNVKLEAVVKGDSKSLFIGLASIFAKVYRDQLMQNYAKQYPGYAWELNAGYGTAKHLEAIAKIGITPIHRKTFKGVKEHYEKGRVE